MDRRISQSEGAQPPCLGDSPSTSTDGTAEEDRAGVAAPQYLPNGRLAVFATAMGVQWAAQSAGHLEASFILPVIQDDFGVTEADVQWVVASYVLIWGCFLLLAGRLCDVLGRKRGYIVGTSTYIMWNILCALMPNLAGLNVCRGFMGVSAAFMLPAALGLIGALAPPGRKRTLSFVAIVCAAGGASGQLFAGIFIEYTSLGWRACFLSVGLVTIVPLLAGVWIVPADPPISKSWRVDWFGASAIGSGLVLILLGLTTAQNSTQGWQAPYIPGLFVGGAVMFAFFAWRQYRLSRLSQLETGDSTPPLIPPHLISWEKRNLLVIYVAAFCIWGASDSLLVFISYLYFDVLQLSAFDAGLRLATIFFSGAGAIVVSLTISSVPPRALIAIGCAISSLSSILFAVRGLYWPFWRADLWALVVLYYGVNSIISAGNTLISQTAGPRDLSMAAAIFQMCCRLGNGVWLATASLIRVAVEKSARRRGEPNLDAVLEGLHSAFWTLAGLSLFFVGFGMKGWEYLESKPIEEVAEESNGDTSERASFV